MKGKNLEEIKLELQKKISRCNQVVSDLENNGAFKIVLEDFAAQRDLIDNNWHLVDDMKKLTELRIMKLSTTGILSILDSYKHDLKMAQEELIKLDNPKEIVNKDFDTE